MCAPFLRDSHRSYGCARRLRLLLEVVWLSVAILALSLVGGTFVYWALAGVGGMGD